MTRKPALYSIVISRRESDDAGADRDYRAGDLCIEWVDYHSEKDIGNQEPGLESLSTGPPGSATLSPKPAKQTSSLSVDGGTDVSNQPGARPLCRSPASEHGPGIPYPVQRQTQGTTELGPGIIHLFKHSQPLSLLEALEADLASGGSKTDDTKERKASYESKVAGKVEVQADAEGQDGTLIAILAVPIWMDVANLGYWLGAWTTCLEGYRMIR
jgi:BRCA1-associated protein